MRLRPQRARALECYAAAKEVARNPSSWGEKVLAGASSEGGRFEGDKTGAMKQQQFSAQTTGLMSKEEYAKKRQEAENEAAEEAEAEEEEVDEATRAALEASAKRKAKERKAKRAKAASMLSFNEDEEGDG